ncbi:MAG: hypothetical protein COB24_01455 [Hyphomicrobiales bacterium]|nr:MAG: hypothetical protein COB24_01455 [Hyphomicrobiales bacterium]
MVKSINFSYRIFANALFAIVLSIVTSVGVSQAANLMRINMSAHIIESSIANLKATEWTLYKSTSIVGDGEEGTDDESNLISSKIQSFTGAIQSIILPVGQYILKAQYGHAVRVKIFKVVAEDKQSFLNLKMTFNLGALKLSSSLGNSKDVISTDVNYIIRNTETGKIVLETSDISKTYYLNQGEYNVTAHYKDIIVTEANIKILANNMNDVSIKHKVGQIDLNIDNIKDDITDIPPTWHIIGAKNRIDKNVTSVTNENILLPAGDYQLLIEWGDFTYATEFGMHPGQVIEFKIPK